MISSDLLNFQAAGSPPGAKALHFSQFFTPNVARALLVVSRVPLMKSWFSNFIWAFRRTTSQQSNTDEEHALPGSTKSSLNADLSYSAGDHDGKPRDRNLLAPTPSETEEGVVFAKNNVVLRVSDATSSPKHKVNKKGEEYGNNSGYFYMRAHEISFHGNTYIVHWLANSELKKAAAGEPNESTSASNNNNAVSIELNTLEMIKIFYDSESGAADCSLSNGQMILYSKDGVFHIFRFISGGLERLTELLKGCKFLRETNQDIDQDNHKQVTFVVYAPRLGLKEMHPAEHEIQTQLTKETWDDLHDREGRITALKLIQKVIPCMHTINRASNSFIVGTQLLIKTCRAA